MNHITIENGFMKKTIGEDEFLFVPEDVTGAFLVKKDVLERYIGKTEGVVIPEGVTEIAQTAFEGVALRSVTLPESMTVIPSCTLHGVETLEAVTLPETVTKIGSCAFFDCSRLKQINIPKQTEIAEGFTFQHCYALADRDGFIILNGILFGYVGDSAFVTVPDGVTRIAEYAFSDKDRREEDREGVDRRIRSVCIPDSVKYIDKEAFGNLFPEETEVLRYRGTITETK